MRCIYNLTAILILLPATTFSWGGETITLQHRTDSSGLTQTVEVDRQRLSKLPQWSPDSGPPPLEIGRALAIAKENIRKQNPKMDDFRIREISFQRIEDYEHADRWYYVLEFDPIVDGRRLFGADYFVVVLMDGTVPETRVKQRMDDRTQ